MKKIYEQMIEAGVKTASHYSDLYVEVNDVSTAIVNAYEFKSNVQTFLCQIEKKPWFDIPFAYDPYWKKITRK